MFSWNFSAFLTSIKMREVRNSWGWAVSVSCMVTVSVGHTCHIVDYTEKISPSNVSVQSSIAFCQNLLKWSGFGFEKRPRLGKLENKCGFFFGVNVWYDCCICLKMAFLNRNFCKESPGYKWRFSVLCCPWWETYISVRSVICSLCFSFFVLIWELQTFCKVWRLFWY